MSSAGRAMTVLLVAGLCSLGAPVLAQRAVQARFFDTAARAAYARGDYEHALIDFLEVARVAPSPGTLYNVALCADLTHRDALAYEAFARYLAGAADEDVARRADAEARLRAIEGRVALVRVSSSPPGATIWVDRRELGSFGTTPQTIVLPPGAHTITLDHPRAREGRVEIVAELGATRDVAVELVARTGPLRVLLDGADGAEIVAEREGLLPGERPSPRALTPGVATSLPVGAYVVTARRAGFRDATLHVLVHEGVEETRTITLTPIPRPTGSLAVRADGPATVFVDGVERAEAPVRLSGLAVGVHVVELRAPGRIPWRGDVEVRDGEVRFVSVTLQRAR